MSADTDHDLIADSAAQRKRPTRTRRKLPTPLETQPAQMVVDNIDFDDPAAEPAEEADDGGTDGQLVEASTCEIALGVDDDAFSSTLLLAAGVGSDEVGVWLRLTPTTIQVLTAQLTDIFHVQQEALGLIASDTGDLDQDEDLDGAADEAEQEKLLRRVSDPAGVRFLRERPGALRWVTVSLGFLLVIAFVLQITVYHR